MTDVVEVRLLGPLEVLRNGAPIEPGGPQQRAVIAWLALADGRVVAADRLAERLWGEDPPASAAGTLQSYISRLRRAVEPDRKPGQPPSVLVSEAPGYALRVDRAHVDLFRFEDAARAGREALTAGRTAAALASFDEALGNWRGDALAGLGGDTARDAIVTRLHEERAVAAEGRFDALLAMGRHAAIVGELHEAVADEPLRERRWAQLALALYRSHRQSDALRALATARSTLAEQVGVDPGPELQSLESLILAQDPSLGWHELSPEPPAEPAPAPTPAPTPASTPARADRGPVLSLAGAGRAPISQAPVGRDLEWARLTAAIGTATIGQPVVIMIEGDAGIGKTTLLDVLAATASHAGWHVAWGRCVDEGLAPALWPFVEVVRSLVNRSDAGAAGEIDESALREFAGAATNSERGRSLVEIADGVVANLRAATAPTLIVIDDLHWADAATLDLLTLVAQRLVTGRAVLAVAHRRLAADASPDVVAALASLARLPVIERLALGGLTRPAVAALMSEVAGQAVDEADVDAVFERTAGHPLFVAELARTPRAARADATAGGSTQPGHPADGHVPEAVRDVVRSRVRHLAPATMELVVLAGLLGADIDLRVLAMASGRDLDTCLDDLDPAVVSHVLVPATPGRFSFAHALVRDALTADVSPLRRARLHLKAADALESLYGVDRDHAEPIAMHRWAALSVGDPLDAAKALVTAAGIAAGRGALARADDLIELALSAAGVAPTGPRRLDLEIDALETLLRIETLRSFMGERLDEIADRIDDVAERHDSDAARVLAHFTRWSNINRGDYRAMDQWAVAARDLAERSTVPYVRLLGRHTWGSHCWLRGWITESVATFRMLLDEDEELRATSPEVRLAPVNHGMNACAPFALAGDEENTARALAAADVKVQARIPTNPASRVDAVFTPALVTAIRGEAARTRDITAGLVRGDLEAEQPHFSPASRIMHGWGAVLTSGSSEPLDLLVRAVAEIDATPVKVGMPMFRSLYAEALLHLGRSADAAAILRDIAAVSEADGDGWWLPETLRLLALAEAANGADPAATAALLARARALADEQGEQLLVMRIDATIAAQ